MLFRHVKDKQTPLNSTANLLVIDVVRMVKVTSNRHVLFAHISAHSMADTSHQRMKIQLSRRPLPLYVELIHQVNDSPSFHFQAIC
mmetsp:Transcript_29730/g.44867  ORF Transcript_29730/g.44867 Transcript_29730/m.44867 type:complete len:86 (+) Transcript_29730:352-609(+)